MSGQYANFLAAFPGHPQSAFYGRPLTYIPGVDHLSARDRMRVPVTPGSVVGAPLNVEISVGVNVNDGDTFAVLDPERDIPTQYERALSFGFKFVEVGMPSAFRLGEFMELLTHTHGTGLGVIAKNALRTSGPFQYLSHPNVFGCVVERNSGTPREYDRLRRDTRRDGLMPVWFVFDGADGADVAAEEIRLYDLKGMGVSFGAGLTAFRYDDSHAVLKPMV